MTEEKENFFDSDDIERSKKLSDDAKRRRVRDLNDIRVILKSPEGRRFLWRTLSKAGIFRDSFTLNSNQTSYNEGRRSTGLDLLIDLHDADVLAFARMQQEFMSEVLSKKEKE